MKAIKYDDGTISCPGHPRGLQGGEPVEEIDLTEREGEIVTWTTSQATPPGVRQPNHLAIVEFEIEGQSVRVLGQLTTGEVEIGDRVRQTYVEQLREPGAGIREPESQEWDGYRFEPTR
ncbi:MAG: OB-fold domain-containing protein [Halalkalicoccus sp.]